LQEEGSEEVPEKALESRPRKQRARENRIVTTIILVADISPISKGRKPDAEGKINAAKLLRACGGCLGARRRRRAWKTAKSPEELSNEC
jgi:hypothetical protein